MADNDVPLPISFDDADKADADKDKDVTKRATRGAGVQVLGPQLKTLDGNIQIGAQQMGKNISQSAQTKQFGGKSSDVITLELDDISSKSKASLVPKITVIELQKNDINTNQLNKIDNDIYNEINTYRVVNNTPQQVCNQLTNIISTYSSDIDFNINNNNIQNGLIFINNYYSVKFNINIINENNGNTLFEFRRQSGDALASAKFLGDLKSKFFNVNAGPVDKDDDKDDDNTLIALDLNVDDLDLKVDNDNPDMMMIHEALIADDVVPDLDDNVETYLYKKLVSANAISKDIIDHKILCQTLIDNDILLHKDINVIRAALLILDKFIGKYNDILLSSDNKLLTLLNTLLKANNYNLLIKKYTIRLLNALSSINTNKWIDIVDNNTVKDIENKWKSSKTKDNKCVTQDMFDQIYTKLN